MSDPVAFYRSGKSGGKREILTPRQEVALSWVYNHPSADKIIDIGCADGIFLEKVILKLPRIEAIGNDLNPEYIKEAKGKGLTIRSFDVTQLWPFSDATFNIIHASAVIEHLFDYTVFFKECYRCLKKDGILILSGPNGACLRCRIELLCGQVPCWYRNFEHIRMWTKKYLASIVHEYGFTMDIFKGVHSQKTFFRLLLEKISPELCAEFVALLRKSPE